MANYRFKAAEIEAMKKNILTHIEHESETETAWRLRCAIEGQLMCCRPSKREAARLERELALYEKLTKNDLPNWQGEPTQPAQPTETPRISTETAETVNVSAEGERTEKTANLNDETRRYIIDTFKTKENLIAKFMDAIKSDKAELDEYKANTRKGGKFRKERMQRLEDSETELAKQMEEWSAIFDEPLPIEEPHDHITIYQSALEQCNALAENPKVILREDVARVKRMDGKTARIVATNLDDGFSHCPLYFIVYVDEMPMLENYATLEAAIESAKTDIPINPFGAPEPPLSPETPQTVECADECDCRICSHCGARFHEGYFLGNEYACSDECAVALYGGDREQFEADLEAEEEEAGTTECYWSIW